MGVHRKVQQARMRLQDANIKKSGKNKFAGYSYYELADFLPEINRIFYDLGLFSNVSFDAEMATLTIVDTEDAGDVVTFTSPMSSAALKGCHEVQNLGAVQTYLRRYLYTNALEIVEHDALDSTMGGEATETAQKHSKPSKPTKTPEKGVKTAEDDPVALRGQIEDLVHFKGADLNKLLAHYEVDRLDALSVEQMHQAIGHLKKK